MFEISEKLIESFYHQLFSCRFNWNNSNFQLKHLCSHEEVIEDQFHAHFIFRRTVWRTDLPGSCVILNRLWSWCWCSVGYILCPILVITLHAVVNCVCIFSAVVGLPELQSIICWCKWIMVTFCVCFSFSFMLYCFLFSWVLLYNTVLYDSGRCSKVVLVPPDRLPYQ